MSLGSGARWVARNLALLTFLGAIAAYFHPPLFLVFAHSFLWFFAVTRCWPWKGEARGQ